MRMRGPACESRHTFQGPRDKLRLVAGKGQTPRERARLDDPKLKDGALWFNPAAFRRAPQFTFGTASRNLPDVRVPGNKNIDILIEKRLSFTEEVCLGFPDRAVQRI